MSVIGPFDREDWWLLLCMKNSVKIMKDTDPVKYRLSIKGDQAVFDNVIRQGREAA